MTEAHSTPSLDPSAIERDIRRTQDEMSRTVDRISDQLTPRSLVNALLDKAEENNVDARYLLDGARRNPLALAMLAGGAIWLVSDNDAKFPKIGAGSSQDAGNDSHHRDYVSHMSSVEWRPNEDEEDYQRRRDIARANYFMIERGHEEDEGSFKKRLDEAGERFRDVRHSWAESGRAAKKSVGDTSTAALTRAQNLFNDNPAIGGLAAAALGAILGALLPLTRAESAGLSPAGSKIRDVVDEQKDQLFDAVRHKKDELVSNVDQALSNEEPSNNQSGESGLSMSSDAQIPAGKAPTI